MNMNEIEFYKSEEDENIYIAILGEYYGKGAQKRIAVNSLKDVISLALTESKATSENLLKLLFKIDNIDWTSSLVTFPDAVVEGEEIVPTPPIFPLPKDLDVMDNLDEDFNSKYKF